MNQTTSAAIIDVCVDTEKGFKGNRAAVVLLEGEITESKMQAIARELDEPATTFLWPSEDSTHWVVRWYAPIAEIMLCGHGSLAAYAFFMIEKLPMRRLQYRDGILDGHADGKKVRIVLDEIPTEEELPIPEALRKGLGIDIEAYYKTSNKYIVRVKSEEDVKSMQPNFAEMQKLDVFSYAVTAPGKEADFVSRTLLPHISVGEDQATGSSHAALTPYWSKQLGKKQLLAYQLSPNGGRFECVYDAPQVMLKAQYKWVGEKEIEL